MLHLFCTHENYISIELLRRRQLRGSKVLMRDKQSLWPKRSMISTFYIFSPSFHFIIHQIFGRLDQIIATSWLSLRFQFLISGKILFTSISKYENRDDSVKNCSKLEKVENVCAMNKLVEICKFVLF